MQEQFQQITTAELLPRVGDLRGQKARLVQISATRLPDHLELTYSFECGQELTNLRLHIAATGARMPSISSIYWCAFLYENEMHDLFAITFDGLVVDFHGNLYQTAIKYPFGSTKPPVAKTATAPDGAPPPPVSPATPTCA